MSGFGKITVVGEHFGQAIVNVLWYRSETISWLQSNPFTSALKFVQDWYEHCGNAYKGAHNANYTMLHVEGVAFTDSFAVATPAPVTLTVNTPGGIGAAECSGSFVAANIDFMLGPQVQVNGTGHALRNRGYISVGPVPETYVDNYGHLIGAFAENLEQLAGVLDDTIIDVELAADFIPIRIHEKWGPRIPVVNTRPLLWRTYSDVLGYRMPRRASVRRSRIGEA